MFVFLDWDYDPVKGHLTAIFDAFKFPDGNTIKFKCNIRVCFGQCQPQNCAGINAYGRKKRESETEIAGEVYTGTYCHIHNTGYACFYIYRVSQVKLDETKRLFQTENTPWGSET